jgi:hypothetical protein
MSFVPDEPLSAWFAVLNAGSVLSDEQLGVPELSEVVLGGLDCAARRFREQP